MRKSRLSHYKQNKLIELCAAGVTARTTAEPVGVNKRHCRLLFSALRLLSFHNSPHLEMLGGGVEIDESYFGGRRKGRRRRGAVGKVVVFGILKRHDKVYTVVANNAESDTLMSVIKQKIMPDSIVIQTA